MSGSFALPGPRLVGFRYGAVYDRQGHLGSLLPENRGEGDDDLLAGQRDAKCRLHGHEAPRRGCTCGIYAYATPGFLVESNGSEWQTPWVHVPMVALHWGRIIVGEFGFRAEHQVVIGIAAERDPIYLQGLDSVWMEAFRKRGLPVQVCGGATRVDRLFALADLGRRYGTLLADVDEGWRVPPQKPFEVPQPTFTPAVPAPATPAFPPKPPLHTTSTRRQTKRFPSTGFCQCECGANVKYGSMFRPGHDSKHKGNLKRRARRGDQAAQDELDARGW